MPIFSSRLVLPLMLAALCLGSRDARAQAAPLSYWIPGWPAGFAGNFSQNLNAYGNFPSFDGSAAGGGFAYTRSNFSNGFFVGSAGGSVDLGFNGINQAGAFGTTGSLNFQAVQFGYNFQNAPLKVFAGFDTLNYDPGIGSALASFNNLSGTSPAYGVHAGVEFQPTSNVSLSLGVGYSQQPGGINSLPLGSGSPLGLGGLR